MFNKGNTVGAMNVTSVDHLVIGAGFAGLCAAIKLQQAGEPDFVVIEKGSDVGGTWRDNTYPGAACDVPSQLYSFSFAPNPDWSMSFSPQPEILAYIIGTGASSIQIVPSIQQQVAHLDVYQRTAPYVIPRNDRSYSKLERQALAKVPGLQSLYRTGIYWAREGYVPGFTLAPKLALPAQKMALANIAKGIKDPELRAKVTPDYQIGCKRILISNTYYPALAADNCEVVTDGIAEITPTGIITADGTARDIDVLIIATGFHTTELPITEKITGRSGRPLSEKWAETGMSAYKGTAVADFPNLFFIVGPNTGLGHSSMVFMIESQVTYIVDALRTMRNDEYGSVEVTEAAESAWSADLQRRMKRTVWSTGGCASWYLDKHGNNTTLWPRTTFAFRGETASFDPGAYTVTASATRPAPTHRKAVTA